MSFIRAKLLLPRALILVPDPWSDALSPGWCHMNVGEIFVSFQNFGAMVRHSSFGSYTCTSNIVKACKSILCYVHNRVEHCILARESI